MRFNSFEELLRYNAENHTNDVALIFDKDGEIFNVTYSEFFDGVLERKAQLEKESANCVGILQAPSAKWLVDTFASVLAGKQTVLLDPMQEPAVIQKMVTATDVALVLTDELTAPYAQAVKTAPVENVEKADGEGDILFFTSGTTNLSKAVVLTSKSLCSSAWNGQQKLPCNPGDNLLCMLPLTHVFGFVCAMLWPMSQGARISLTRGMRYIPFDCKYFNPTIISVVPSVLKFLIATNALNDDLRVILVGAGPASEQMLAAAKAKGIEVRFGYGLTETSSGVAISCGDDPFAMSVCPDDKITIADDGEILIYAPTCVMKGYYKNESATREVLENGIFRSGDLGKFDKDGNLHITGRKKDILVLENGTKIFLAEWEADLQSTLGIEDVALSLVDNVITLFVGNKDGNVDENKVKDDVKKFNSTHTFDQQIGDVKVLDGALPRTATGKIKRYSLH